MSSSISDVLDKLDAATQAYTFNGYAALVTGVHTPVTLAITAYIAFIGWMTIQGWGQLTVGQAVKHTLKIAVAYTLATQWNYFAEFIYNVFTQGPNELSAVLMQDSDSGSSSVNAALQASFDQGVAMGDKLWHGHGISMMVAAVLVWLLNFLVSGIALLEFAVAKCGLAVTLVLAPVFSLFLLWNATKGFFDRWLSVALGFGLVPLFLSAVLLIINQLMQMGLNEIDKATASGTEIMRTISTFVLGSVASFGLLLRASAIAAQVVGGFSVTSLGVAVSAARLADVASGFKAARGAAGRWVQAKRHERAEEKKAKKTQKNWTASRDK